MIRNGLLRSAFVFALTFSFVLSGLPTIGYAQTGVATSAESQYQKGLTAIEQKVDARRKELGIPGMSLAIVKDDQVIYSSGLGL